MSAEKLITDHIDIWTSAVQAKSSSGRGSSKKRELYGIKKLRELILELAVRGKLVPQDPNDEPASVLLERITAEKAQLVKEKKIKTTSKLKHVSIAEQPFSIPPNWQWSRLGELSKDIHYGYTASAKHESDGIRLLRITDIQDDKVNWATVPACEITSQKAETYLLENDDILIARTGGTIGKSYLVENIDVHAVFASYLIRVRKITELNASFVKVFLGSQLYWSQLYANAAGTGQPNVNATALKSLIIPIPTLEEQHRIVAKVDELMALCDQLEQQTEASLDAHQVLVETLLATLTNSQDATELMANWARISEHFDTLFTTEQSIDQLKQTILQLAVMGKLVPQDPNDEPAAKLLERIAEEKALLVKEKKIKKEKPQPFISEDGRLFELPNGWVWSNIGETFLVTGGLQKTPKRTPVLNHYPYLAVANVQRGRLELDDLKRFEVTSEELERYRLMPGDLMVVEGNGSENEIGRCAIWSGEVQDCLHQNHLIKCRPLSLDLSSWVLQTLNSPFGIAVMKSLAVTSSGLYNLSVGKIRSIAFPLPPLKEQHRIVAKVDGLMALCDQLKSRLQTSQQTQLALAEALVEQAL
ncbi:restriction endonuclease subunit S [Vibrio cholerae]|uniref:restriction endonuclease subunit S n=1 Tax=Vibrio cholerae TaxID=666 RepID=UPI00307FF46C